MSNLPILSTSVGMVPGKLDRQISREVSQTKGFGMVLSAREIAKVEAVANVTEAALVATAHVSSVEALLIGQVPHAEARLRHIADAGCAGMGYVVMSMGRQIR
jgi:hypothetical protein